MFGRPISFGFQRTSQFIDSWLFYIFFSNSVRLAIRKVMYAPSKPGEQPSVETSKEFLMSPSKLHLECSLDKEVNTAITH